jgi:hypothetical protein
MVIVKVAVPFPPPPQFTVQAPFRPLQEEKDKTVETTRNKRARFEFMQTPHVEIQHQAGRAMWLGNPQQNSSLLDALEPSLNPSSCPTVKGVSAGYAIGMPLFFREQLAPPREWLRGMCYRYEFRL